MSQYFQDNYEQDHDDKNYPSCSQQKHCLNMINCILERAEKINSKKYKVCLEYHIGNCHGPCVGKVEPAYYEADIDSIRNIVKGNFKSAIA